MNPSCDLHTHSIYSDGTYTPGEIIDAALHIGLSAVALCDHNTVDGLPDFIEQSQGKPIEAICGSEFSVDYNGTELHLLGLFIEEKHFPVIRQMMQEVQFHKEQSNLQLVASLNKAGYHMDYDLIKSNSPTGRINRAHIAAALTELKYTDSIRTAFHTLLSPSAGHYIEPKRITVWEMLSFLRSIHAVSVLAHPFLNLNESELREFLPKAKKEGLMGMETVYSSYDNHTASIAASMAQEFGLLPSGGSDFHGSNKPDIFLGRGKGNLFVPYSWVAQLKSSMDVL